MTKRAKTDKAELFMFYWRVAAPRNLTPVPEYDFTRDIGRKHRFDFAWLPQKVAVEIEGNAWHVAGGGRHMQDTDLEKYNLAAARGWRVFRYSPSMLTRDPAACIEQVVTALVTQKG